MSTEVAKTRDIQTSFSAGLHLVGEENQEDPWDSGALMAVCVTDSGPQKKVMQDGRAVWRRPTREAQARPLIPRGKAGLLRTPALGGRFQLLPP